MTNSLALSQEDRGTTDASVVVREMQEKYLAVNKQLYIIAFMDP